MAVLTALARDPLGQSGIRSSELVVVTVITILLEQPVHRMTASMHTVVHQTSQAPVTHFIDWYTGDFVRIRNWGITVFPHWYVVANSAWNYDYISQDTRWGPSPYPVVIEVWAGPGGKSKYLGKQAPTYAVDMRTVGGRWRMTTAEDSLCFWTFPLGQTPPNPFFTSDPEPTP